MMKVSLEWLQEYCTFEGDPAELAELLKNLGMGLEAIEEIDGDVCLDLEITSNRNDLNGVIGIAREIAAATGQSARIPEVELKEEGTRVHNMAGVRVEVPDLCPRYTARVITGVRIGPSPGWMQRRLEAVGLRPINNVVDITNYVLFEACQPLHAFDFDKLAGGVIVVRTAREGETLIAIDGTECELRSDMLVIADAKVPVAIAGVMGGLDTEISEETRAILLESAQFDPVRVRRTSRGLGLVSESSYRFEHGVDPEGVEWASRRAAALIQEYAGGTVCKGVIDVWKKPPEKRPVQVRVPYIERILGYPVPPERVKEILDRLGLEIVSADAAQVTVKVPSFRPDLQREIDLVEEVARHNGYDKLPDATGLQMRPAERSPMQRLRGAVAEILMSAGLDEVITVSFLPEDLAAAVSPWSDGRPVLLRNPVRKDENALRGSLVPHLLRVLKTNEDRGNHGVNVYELGHVYLRKATGTEMIEKLVIGLAHSGGFSPAKGVIELLIERLRFKDRARFTPVQFTFLDGGKAAACYCGQRMIAYIGIPTKALLERFDLRGVPAVAEVDVDALLAEAGFDTSFTPLPKFPSTDRDLAIVVDEKVTWEQIVKVIEDIDLPILRAIEFFDLFRGKSIPRGKKSVAFRLVFQSDERTLTNEEVNAIRDGIVERLGRELGAQLR